MLAGLKIEAEVYVPLMLHGLCAGCPSPADDYIEESIDLTRLLIPILRLPFFGRSTAIPCETPAYSTVT